MCCRSFHDIKIILKVVNFVIRYFYGYCYFFKDFYVSLWHKYFIINFTPMNLFAFVQGYTFLNLENWAYICVSYKTPCWKWSLSNLIRCQILDWCAGCPLKVVFLQAENFRYDIYVGWENEQTLSKPFTFCPERVYEKVYLKDMNSPWVPSSFVQWLWLLSF